MAAEVVLEFSSPYCLYVSRKTITYLFEKSEQEQLLSSFNGLFERFSHFSIAENSAVELNSLFRLQMPESSFSFAH